MRAEPSKTGRKPLSIDRPKSSMRTEHRVLRALQTRWLDNDIYVHLKTIIHYGLYDTAISGFLMSHRRAADSLKSIV